MASIEWGNVGEWVGGVSAAIAVAFAGYELRRVRTDRQQAETEHREAMARAVSVSAEYPQTTQSKIARANAMREHGQDAVYLGVKGEVHNGGDYPIDDVIVYIADFNHQDSLPGHEGRNALEYGLGTVAARSMTSFAEPSVEFVGEPIFGEITSMAAVRFTDAWGTHWYRAARVLEQRESPPRWC